MYQSIEQRNINIHGQDYGYTLRRRRRVKYLRLSIEHDGAVTVTAPIAYPLFLIKKFLDKKMEWIAKGVSRIKNQPSLLGLKHSASDIRKYKKQARILVTDRLAYFNSYYNFKYHRIAIRNQKSRWGSCSSSKNLNFNYRLALLPEELADYIIVHELCHLREMNHSVKFWQLVGETIFDYKIRQKKLKKI